MRLSLLRRVGLAVTFALALSTCVFAEVRLPALIGDNMVLQQGMDAQVWGWADAGERVTVKGSWNANAVSTRAGSDGRWMVKLETPEAGGPHTISVQGQNSIELTNVMVGEVWVCSGQSNMQMSLAPSQPWHKGVLNFEEEIAAADHPLVRLFTVAPETAEEPREDCTGEWVPCSPEIVAPFSAVAYFFGREIHRELAAPIGLINTSWGGTPAEAWTSREGMETVPDLTTLQDNCDDSAARHNVDRPAFEARLKQAQAKEGDSAVSIESLVGLWDFVSGSPGSEYQATLTVSLNNGDLDVDMAWTPEESTDVSFENGVLKWTFPLPQYSPAPFECEVTVRGDTFMGTIATGDNPGNPIRGLKRASGVEDPPRLLAAAAQNCPSSLFNAMIAPLVPYAIRGSIWYQGESNTGRAYAYRRLFPAMIQDWRRVWGQGDFPFYYVQIAPFRYGDPVVAAELREAQLMTLSVPNTGMAVTLDIGDVDDIHPRNKQEVGRRLALWALAKTYGAEDLVYSGPVYRSMSVEGDAVRIEFDHVGGGLVAKDGPLTDFTIAGEDRAFVEADAVIDGDAVVVSAPGVKKPVAVRFGWTSTATPNLFNKEGLPASTFRTDDWPGVTHPDNQGER